MSNRIYNYDDERNRKLKGADVLPHGNGLRDEDHLAARMRLPRCILSTTGKPNPYSRSLENELVLANVASRVVEFSRRRGAKANVVTLGALALPPAGTLRSSARMVLLPAPIRPSIEYTRMAQRRQRDPCFHRLEHHAELAKQPSEIGWNRWSQRARQHMTPYPQRHASPFSTECQERS